MTEEEISDKIEAWHFRGAGVGQDFMEFMGWDLEQYWNWVATGGVTYD